MEWSQEWIPIVEGMFLAVILIGSVMHGISLQQEAARRRKVRGALLSLATQLGRGFTSMECSDRGGSLEIVTNGVPATLTSQMSSHRGIPATEIHFDIALPGTIHVASEGALSRLGRLVGLHDIQVGNPEFDGRFRIRGAPEAWVREALDPKVQGLVMRLAELSEAQPANDPIGLRVGSTGFSVKVKANLLDRPTLIQIFHDYAIEILCHFQATAVNRACLCSALELSVSGKCPVCAQEVMEAEGLRCAQCQTLHYRECWDYVGGCSIYACGSRLTTSQGMAGKPAAR